MFSLSYLTRVINKPCSIPSHCRIHNQLIVYTEHVAANVFSFIIFFPLVCQHGAYHLSCIFYYHFTSFYVPQAKQSPTVYVRTIYTYCFLWGLFKMSETHRHWQIWTGSSPVKIFVRHRLIKRKTLQLENLKKNILKVMLQNEYKYN